MRRGHYYEAWVLHFRESTGTGYVSDTDTRTVLLGYTLITHLFFIFYFTTGTRVVLLWYARGTLVVSIGYKIRIFYETLFNFIQSSLYLKKFNINKCVFFRTFHIYIYKVVKKVERLILSNITNLMGEITQYKLVYY
jgi:hypothetical protein